MTETELARIRIDPEDYHLVDNIVTKSFLFIPIEHNSTVIEKLVFDKALKKDEDGHVPIKTTYNDSNIMI